MYGTVVARDLGCQDMKGYEGMHDLEDRCETYLSVDCGRIIRVLRCRRRQYFRKSMQVCVRGFLGGQKSQI